MGDNGEYPTMVLKPHVDPDSELSLLMESYRMHVATQLQWSPTLRLRDLDISGVKDVGVYLIGFKAIPEEIWTIYVGRGMVAERLQEHISGKSDTSIQILRWEEEGALYVTWMPLNPFPYFSGGVEKGLASRLRPLVGERHSTNIPEVIVCIPEGWYQGRAYP